MDTQSYKKIRIFLGDLSYFNKYSNSGNSVPLNIGYIASYILKLYENKCEVTLFKNPEKLLSDFTLNPPDIVGLSCSSWNIHLDILIVDRIKKIKPDCLVVLGGPNIDFVPEEQFKLYSLFKGKADIFLLSDGELGFSNVLQELIEISEKEWVDLKNLEKTQEVVVSRETLDYLKIEPSEEEDKYSLKMSLSEQQLAKLSKFNEQYKADDDSYFYNALQVINPRKNLRYQVLTVEPIKIMNSLIKI